MNIDKITEDEKKKWAIDEISPDELKMNMGTSREVQLFKCFDGMFTIEAEYALITPEQAKVIAAWLQQ